MLCAEPLPKRLDTPHPLLPENVSCHEYETKLEAKKAARPRESGKPSGGSDSKRSRDGHGSMQSGERKRRSTGSGRARLDEHGEIIRDAGWRDSVSAKASSSGDSERRRSAATSKPSGGGMSTGGDDSAYDPLGGSNKKPPPSSSDLFGS